MKAIEIESLNDLKPGTVIRSKLNAISYIVVACYGNRVTAVRTADITNPSEWEIMKS